MPHDTFLDVCWIVFCCSGATFRRDVIAYVANDASTSFTIAGIAGVPSDVGICVVMECFLKQSNMNVMCFENFC